MYRDLNGRLNPPLKKSFKDPVMFEKARERFLKKAGLEEFTETEWKEYQLENVVE